MCVRDRRRASYLLERPQLPQIHFRPRLKAASLFWCFLRKLAPGHGGGLERDDDNQLKQLFDLYFLTYSLTPRRETSEFMVVRVVTYRQVLQLDRGPYAYRVRERD